MRKRVNKIKYERGDILILKASPKADGRLCIEYEKGRWWRKIRVRTFAPMTKGRKAYKLPDGIRNYEITRVWIV